MVFRITVQFTTFLTLCLLGNFACFFVVCQYFQNHIFRKILSGIPSECQTGWIQIRPDIMSGLIWVQTVYKGYPQTALVDIEFKADALNIYLGVSLAHEFGCFATF